MTNVVLVSPKWPPESAQNGIVTSLGQLVEPLRGLGLDVRIVAQFFEKTDEAQLRRDGVGLTRHQKNTPAHYVYNRLLRRTDVTLADETHQCWQLSRTLRAMHRDKPIDVCEIEEGFGRSWRIAGAVPAKQVVRLHGPWFLCVPALGLDRNALENLKRVEWEGEGIRRADVVTSPSRFALDEVRRRYELTLPDARVIPNAMPLAERTWSEDQAAPRSILFVGRVDRLKGADTVIEAYVKVRATHPGATLTFVGPDRGFPDGARFDDYVARALSPDERAGLTYLGAQPPSKIRELRPTHAVTVVASRFETFGMTVLEAMSAASPVLASDAGGIAEVLDWAPELLFEPGDSDALAAKLGWLFDEPETAAKLGRRGREVCAERYVPEAVAKQTADVYLSLAAR